ncbi:amidohydrolase family protein, partial [Bacillus tequilensis]|nr:amidohydrolase family protein [Bacillus tequilensis]
LSDGTLACSIFKINDGARHMREFTNCSWMNIANITSANAPKQLRIFYRKDSVTVRTDANLVIVNCDCEVMLTI